MITSRALPKPSNFTTFSLCKSQAEYPEASEGLKVLFGNKRPYENNLDDKNSSLNFQLYQNEADRLSPQNHQIEEELSLKLQSSDLLCPDTIKNEAKFAKTNAKSKT